MGIITISSHLKKTFERIIQYMLVRFESKRSLSNVAVQWRPPQFNGSLKEDRLAKTLDRTLSQLPVDDSAMVVEGDPIYAISC
jgi:hypothetical protein